MKLLRELLLGGLLAQLPLLAVYAPIPEQEQGKAWTFTLKSGASYDSNIFGGPTDAISSEIYSATVKAAFNASLTEQTFGTAYYQATLDHYTDRPGEKNLASHELFTRLAHAFSSVTTIDVIDFFQISKNPESLLAGLPLNTDQSFKRNQLDGSFTTSVTEKASVTVKYRNTYFAYDDAVLGTSLDRIENLYGLAGTYGVLPETRAVVEYRHQDILYRKNSDTKDKKSDFLLGGLDQKASEKLTLSGRLGVEYRRRSSERDTTSPTAELSARYDYAPQSFLSTGYTYSIEESSNTTLFTDTEVNRFFVNLQHSLTQRIVASGSFTYEPSSIQGRRGQLDVNETTLRFGGGISYLPTKNWTVSLTYDWDKVSSDDANREMLRHRVALNVSYIF